MKKNVLLQKLSSYRKSVLVFLLAICTSYAAFAQKQITGKVTTSDDGSSVPGVSVKIKGSSTGTITDVNGSFKLSAPADAVLMDALGQCFDIPSLICPLPTKRL